MKGIIALDIDGTITPKHQHIPKAVVDTLDKLYREGWSFVFITGRTFQWGFESLSQLPFPYSLAVQNGAIILEMPQRRIIAKRYLDRSIFPTMEKICADHPTDFVIYAGYEHQDRCFFRPSHFSDAMLSYLAERRRLLDEVWEPVETFASLEIGQFPSIKCIAESACIEQIAGKIEEELALHVPIIKDPINSDYRVAQATHPQVNKGQALLDLVQILGVKGSIIAAGDDNNDKTMLEVAHIKIAMGSAPQELLQLADIVAPPATENGIIEGLRQAIDRLS
jgi:Cof subfamily protein (haloacid dehalogenase superfamily)